MILVDFKDLLLSKFVVSFQNSFSTPCLEMILFKPLSDNNYPSMIVSVIILNHEVKINNRSQVWSLVLQEQTIMNLFQQLILHLTKWIKEVKCSLMVKPNNGMNV